MLIEDRHNAILAVLARQGSATVKELHKRLKVSPETIRRDLTLLAQRNYLKKARGGALALDGHKPGFQERRVSNIEAKRAIGILAASLVPDGATVVMDCGTTVQCVAEALLTRTNLTVITNDMQICQTLARRNGNRIFLLGGEILDDEDATSGPDALIMLSHYTAEIAFIGAGGITDEPCLMTYTRAGGDLRRRMLDSAKIAAVVADHSKFERATPVRVDNFQKVTHLVTDVNLPPYRRKVFQALSVEVLVADGKSKRTTLSRS